MLMVAVEVPATAEKSNLVCLYSSQTMSIVGFIEKLYSRCQFSPHMGLVIKL